MYSISLDQLLLLFVAVVFGLATQGVSEVSEARVTFGIWHEKRDHYANGKPRRPRESLTGYRDRIGGSRVIRVAYLCFAWGSDELL